MTIEIGSKRTVGLRPGEELTVVALSSALPAETPTDLNTTQRLRSFVQRNSDRIFFLLGGRADDETDLFVVSGREIELLAKRKRRLRVPDWEFAREIARVLEQGGAQLEMAQEAAEALVKVINGVGESLPPRSSRRSKSPPKP